MIDNDDLEAGAASAWTGLLAYAALTLLSVTPWRWPGAVGAVLLSLAISGSVTRLGKDWRGR